MQQAAEAHSKPCMLIVITYSGIKNCKRPCNDGVMHGPALAAITCVKPTNQVGRRRFHPGCQAPANRFQKNGRCRLRDSSVQGAHDLLSHLPLPVPHPPVNLGKPRELSFKELPLRSPTRALRQSGGGGSTPAGATPVCTSAFDIFDTSGPRQAAKTPKTSLNSHTDLTLCNALLADGTTRAAR